MTAHPERQHLTPPHLAMSGQVGWGEVTGRGDGTPSPEAMQWACAVLTEALPALDVEPRTVQVLRDGRKRLAVLQLSSAQGLVLKQYSDDRGRWTRRWLQRLAEAGFAPPARFAVTPARGWSSQHRTLVTDVAPGSAWSHWLLAPGADRNLATVAAADWLSRLQSLPVTLPDRTSHRAGEDLRRQSRLLADQFPDHASRLLRVAKAAGNQLYGGVGAAAADLVASHGDLHPENLYVAGGGPAVVTAIDVDTAGLRRPSYDVGYALAQLLVVSWMRTGSFRAGARAGLAFWRRWTAQGGADVDAVPAEVARALTQSLHFELVTYRTGRTELLDRWLDVAEAALASGVPDTFVALTTQEVPA